MFEFNNSRYLRRGDLQDSEAGIVERLEDGTIQTPSVVTPQINLAGGTNHFPDSDVSYSKQAATVPGTLPGDAGDANQEAYRFYWAVRGANVVLDAAHALKAVGHSLYAANEAVNTGIPIWNRIDGWPEFGSLGTQYDIVVQLLNKVVGPGEHWYFLFRCRSTNVAAIPDGMEAFVGLWVISASYEGWAKGDPFNLSYEVAGSPAAQSINYRVLAQSDSGFAILSNILSVTNGPTILSTNDYIKVFYDAGPGFMKFDVYKEVSGVFSLVHTVRNSAMLQFNDVGAVGIPQGGWPVESDDRPLAYAQTGTRNGALIVGAIDAAFELNQLHVFVPNAYDSKLTNADGQFVRFGLSAPTAVDRQLAFDKFWWSATLNEWAPDPAIRFSDSSIAIPSVSPSTGNPGSGGIFVPPDPGGGGGSRGHGGDLILPD